MKMLGLRIEVSQADEMNMMRKLARRIAARRFPARTRITSRAA